MPNSSEKRSRHDQALDARKVFPGTTASQPVNREIVTEAPVSIEFNGIGYAVMMATPVDLEDFVTGFALTEQLVDSIDQIMGCDIHAHEQGWIVRCNIIAEKAETLFERARVRVSDSSCGICGIENLETFARPLPRVEAADAICKNAIFRALHDLEKHQPANAATGGHHAAVWADPEGVIACAREDVGRHNALDKLIGAMARTEISLSPGFFLTTSRCSYEIVEKSVIVGATTLVTISVPTSLAIERASQAGLQLVSLARSDSFLDFSKDQVAEA